VEPSNDVQRLKNEQKMIGMQPPLDGKNGGRYWNVPLSP
jgi:hypothetical protein